MIGEFMSRCEQYFALPGRMIDQPFRRRLSDGVIRCYMVGDEDAEPAPPNATRYTVGPRQPETLQREVVRPIDQSESENQNGIRFNATGTGTGHLCAHSFESGVAIAGQRQNSRRWD
jgi:hypothetical protein